MCANSRLTDYLREVGVYAAMPRNMEIQRGKIGRRKQEQPLGHHRLIPDAVVDRDVAQAEQAIVRHIGHMMENLGPSIPEGRPDGRYARRGQSPGRAI
jgi:DNA-binding GntR family transcriptional regulator